MAFVGVPCSLNYVKMHEDTASLPMQAGILQLVNLEVFVSNTGIPTVNFLRQKQMKVNNFGDSVVGVMDWTEAVLPH